MPHTGRYLVVYDVSSDRERRRVGELLLGYGFRIQKSVFECRLGAATLAQLASELQALGLETGFVLIDRVDPAGRRLTIGAAGPAATPDDRFAFLA